MIGLSLLSFVSKHNMCSYYDWVVVVVRQLTLCGHIMIGLSVLSSVSKHNIIIIRPHIVFTDGRQQRQPNYNTTTYYVY
jgi:hypothetical protein